MSTAIQTLKENILKENILTEVGLYKWELLAAALRVEKKYWAMYPQIKKQVAQLVNAQRKDILASCIKINWQHVNSRISREMGKRLFPDS